ncbi:hypothetical protein NFI96_003640 [Prochilodus magdalenae]|nr:hypothetical protein NFI96_003640 [Prochilodus magdalenae]
MNTYRVTMSQQRYTEDSTSEHTVCSVQRLSCPLVTWVTTSALFSSSKSRSSRVHSEADSAGFLRFTIQITPNPFSGVEVLDSVRISLNSYTSFQTSIVLGCLLTVEGGMDVDVLRSEAGVELGQPSVFKGVGRRREEVRGAEEVAEDESTATELPVDQEGLHVGVAKDHSVKEVAESAGVWKRTVIRVYLGTVPGKASTTSGPPDQFSDAPEELLSSRHSSPSPSNRQQQAQDFEAASRERGSFSPTQTQNGHKLPEGLLQGGGSQADKDEGFRDLDPVADDDEGTRLTPSDQRDSNAARLEGRVVSSRSPPVSAAPSADGCTTQDYTHTDRYHDCP